MKLYQPFNNEVFFTPLSAHTVNLINTNSIHNIQHVPELLKAIFHHY